MKNAVDIVRDSRTPARAAPELRPWTDQYRDEEPKGPSYTW